MKHVLFLVLLASIPQAVIAQNAEKERTSLLQKLPLAKTDSARIDILFFLGESYWFARQLPPAIDYLKKVINLSEVAKDYRHSCNAQLLLANVFMKVDDFDSAFHYLDGCLSCSQTNNQPEHIPKVYDSMSMLYYTLGDHEKAMDLGLKAINLYEKSPLPKISNQSVFALLDVGRILNKQGQYQKATDYFNQALKKAENTADPNFIIPTLVTLAGNYYSAGKLDDSKIFYKKAYEFSLKIEKSEIVVESQKGLGLIAVSEKKYPEAIRLYRQAIEICKTENIAVMLDDMYSSIGNAYMLNNQLDSAGFYFQKSLSLLESNGRLNLREELYGRLAQLALLKGNKEEAITFLQKEKITSDSLFSTEKHKAIGKMEILYQTEKKQKAIYALRADNNNKELVIDRGNRTILIILILTAGMLLVGSLLYRNIWQKRLLADKERKIQEQQIRSLERQQQVVSLQSMVNGQETERTRIAKDLHDGLGGLFSTVKMYFSTLEHEQQQLKESDLFKKSFEMVDTAATEVRRIAHNMMPEVLLKLGLVNALQDLCNNVSAGRLTQVSLIVKGMENRLDPSMEIMLYRIVQELLNNIIKHAHASHAIVQFIRSDDRLSVTVEDDGKGFNTEHVCAAKNTGMENIKSRVNYLNGTLTIESEQDLGTTVMMDFLIGE